MTRLRQPEALRAFIVGISLRVARNHLRSKRVRAIVGLIPDVDLLPASTIADPETRDAVRRLDRLLGSLTAADRSPQGVSLRAKRDEVLSVHFEGFPSPQKAQRRDRIRESL